MGEIKKAANARELPGGRGAKTHALLISSGEKAGDTTTPNRSAEAFPAQRAFFKWKSAGSGGFCAYARRMRETPLQRKRLRAGRGRGGSICIESRTLPPPCAQWTARAYEAPRPSHKRDAARFLIIPSGRPRCGRRFRPAQGPRCSPWPGGCSSRFQTAAHRGRSGRWRALWSRSGAACRRAWAS